MENNYVAYVKAVGNYDGSATGGAYIILKGNDTYKISSKAVPGGGQLSITAGGMTEGNVTYGQAYSNRKRVCLGLLTHPHLSWQTQVGLDARSEFSQFKW